MSQEIVGTLKVDHCVDPNGSFMLSLPIRLPPAKLAPEVTLSYHSAANSSSAIGSGWALKGISLIERTNATLAQDGLRGTVNYDVNDRFMLNGQRLVSLGNNEYRFEVEQWSKIVAVGSDPANPDHWIEYLPDGSSRTYGASPDSNIKALGKSATRVWAVTELKDSFSNYVTYSYLNDSTTGAFYASSISFGGNHNLHLDHQREVQFAYDSRPDVRVIYVGGSKVLTEKRLKAITSVVQGKISHSHKLSYDQAPSTGVSRLTQVSLQDAAGATVRPVKLSWVDGNPSVFDAPHPPVVIDPKDSTAQLYPMDVSAKGKSDLVIASKRLVNGSQRLHLDVHEADADGIISKTPSTTFNDISYPTQLIPLDFSGDGRNDFLHVVKSLDSYTLTILLSTKDGFKAQTQSRLVFKPEAMTGTFYAGDFEGNGHIGLVYIYHILKSGHTQIRFVQFTSDGSVFNKLFPSDGPSGIPADSLRVVVADLNGNGTEDVLLISSKLVSSRNVVNIDLLASQKGRIVYRDDGPLRDAGHSIPFLQTTTFLPYGADEDGKTSLVVVSKNIASGHLQFQMLRSSGPTLLPPTSPVVTDIPFNGNVTLAKTTSPSSVDIINTFKTPDSKVKVDVMRFFADAFVHVSSVTQPSIASSLVTWADLRGLGRADCLLVSHTATGSLSITRLPCATPQPIDYVSGYENGLGAKVAATYAPLSDPTTYIADSTPQTALNGSPLSATSGMARNVAFTTSLLSTSASTASPVGTQSRSQIVHFPSYVVKHLHHAPYAAQPDVVDHSSYTYKNARYSYDGRGWQGFESITKSSKVLGSDLTTSYFQEFPLCSLVKEASSVVSSSKALLQTSTNAWTSNSSNDGKNQYVSLTTSKESHYEDGARTYDVSASYNHDQFGNITKTTIQTDTDVPRLVIEAEYKNDTTFWTIGNKTSEIVKQSGSTLKETRYMYHQGSTAIEEQRQWTKGEDGWLVRKYERDATGNESVVRGPGPALSEYFYDPTYTNCIKTFVHTSEDATTALPEFADYDLLHPHPISTTSFNGEVTSFVYDVLGRVIETKLNGTVATKQEYTTDGANFLKTEWAFFDPSQSTSYKTVSHIDGLGRSWKTERPSPDNPDTAIISESKFDGAGRLVQLARDFFSGSAPSYTTVSYDPLSRVIHKTLPAPAGGSSPLQISYAYSFKSGATRMTETRTDGKRVEESSHIIKAIPNPAPTKFSKTVVVEAVDELNHSIKTRFDGLARPIAVTDPTGVELALQYDGLSRIVDRSIRHLVNGSPKLINHTTALFDDDIGSATITNNLTKTSTVTTYDWNGRATKRITPQETFSFEYDKGGQYSKNRLMSVTSSNGFKRSYDYDLRGNIISDTLAIDGLTFPSKYTWTMAGDLIQAENPNKSIIQRTLHPDGQSVGKITLADSSQTVRASVDFSSFDNVYSKPLICKYGNGIIAKSTLSPNGSISTMDLTMGSNLLHSQQWTIDSFSRIDQHEVKAGTYMEGKSFQYDAAGRIIQHSPTTPSSRTDSFVYDQSGNLSHKDGFSHVNEGWQLTKVLDQSNTLLEFKYSEDGNMISRLDGSGKETRSMKYDSESRLAKLDGTSFVYDHNGQLIKASLNDGTTRLYPTPSYEVDISPDGKMKETSYIVQGHRRASLSNIASSHQVMYYHTDHLGSTVAVSNDAGELITQYEYDPHGRVTLVKGEDTARYKFSGKEIFGDLYHFGARFYDPTIGRFTTLDHYPLSLEGIRPSTFNMYSFSRNDPINFVDLNGNAPVPWWHWAVDALLITAGVAITIASGGALATTIGSAFVGAGVSGLLYDIQHTITGENYSDKDWGIQLGIGALAGAISGGASAALDAMLPAATFGNLVTKGVGVTVKSASLFAARTTVRIGIQSAISSGTGVLSQLTQNAIEHKDLNEGLGDAASRGAWQGAIGGALGNLIGAAGREPTAVNRFWQKSGSYSLVEQNQRSYGNILAQLTKTVVNGPTKSIGIGMATWAVDQNHRQPDKGAQTASPQPLPGVQASFPRFLSVENSGIM